MAFATRASLSLSRAASTSAAAPKARRAAAASPESTSEAEPVAPPPAPKKDSFADFFEFKSWGPEVVNGRLAMVAFFTGAAAEMASGMPTLTQFTESHWAFVLATLLIMPASFMPRFQGETTAKPESKENTAKPE